MQPHELKAIRKAAGLSQHELGEAIGLSRVTVGLMERDEAPITDRTAKAVRAFCSQSRTLADYFAVEPMGGYHCVIRRRLRQFTGGAAMASFNSSTLLYGRFKRRDHAYRWSAALTRAEITGDARRSRELIRAGLEPISGSVAPGPDTGRA